MPSIEFTPRCNVYFYILVLQAPFLCGQPRGGSVQAHASCQLPGHHGGGSESQTARSCCSACA